MPQTVKLSIDEQIKFLNESVKLVLGPSLLHGVGVMAFRDIIQGEKLYCQSDTKNFYTIPYLRFKELDDKISELILGRWPSIVNGSYFLHPHDDARLLSFMNHGRAMYDPVTDTILQKVGRGTEILEDYRNMPNAKRVYSFI
jgi:hypothetical protein